MLSRVNEPAAPFNPSTWDRSKQVPPSIADISNAANTVASVGRDIEARLDYTMSAMITRLTTDSPVVTSTASNCPSGLTNVAPAILGPPHIHTQNDQESVVPLLISMAPLSGGPRKRKGRKSEKCVAEEAVTNPVSRSMTANSSKEPNDFGPTLGSLTSPCLKSLMAQIDDIDMTLGRSVNVPSASNGSEQVAAACVGPFDQFLSHKVRRSPFDDDVSVQQPGVLGVKRKNLSPSPFRTAETTAPPRLYVVPPTHDVDPVSVVVEQDMKKIVAPSDQTMDESGV